MPIRRFSTHGALVVAIAAIAMHAVSAAAADSPPTPSADRVQRSPLLAWKPRAWRPATTAGDRAGSAGLQVAIDPVDGAFSMPLQPIASDRVLVGDDPTPIVVDYFANGRMVAHLDDRFAQYSVVTIGADGKPHWSCVTGPALARAATLLPPPRVEPGPGTVWEDK